MIVGETAPVEIVTRTFVVERVIDPHIEMGVARILRLCGPITAGLLSFPEVSGVPAIADDLTGTNRIALLQDQLVHMQVLNAVMARAMPSDANEVAPCTPTAPSGMGLSNRSTVNGKDR